MSSLRRPVHQTLRLILVIAFLTLQLSALAQKAASPDYTHNVDPFIGVDWGGSPQRFKMSGGAVLHEYITLHAWSGPLSHRVFTAGQSGRIVAGRIARRFPKPS